MPRPDVAPLAAPRSGASAQRPIGLVAGWGRYPVVVAQALSRQGFAVHCLGVEGHADPGLSHWCADYATIGVGKLGRAIRYFHRHNVARATLAGKFHKTLLFRRGLWIRHLPDWRTIKCFYPHLLLSRKDRKDDTLLTALVDAFAADGICFEPATDYAPELLVRYGKLTARGPTAAQCRDIEFGWNVAKEMGRLDIGQSVAVKDRATIAVEAIEGTDACIARAGTLCQSGGFTLVKVAKPRQDMRFDVPTIGLGTVENLVQAGGRVLAVEAGRTIIIDEQEVVQFANRHNLAIVALEKSGLIEHNPAFAN
ncbi:MAG: LpxI family protein [Pirellulales bacterium]